MRRRTATILITVVAFLVLGFGALLVSSLVYDKSNPRNRPNSYLIEVSVEVHKPLEYVYEFVKYRKADIYTELTSMHDKFEILNADGLVEGAEIECIERDEDDVVHHRYVVTKDVEDELIQYESTPSIIYDRETNRKIGECNTYVYYDFERLDDNRTRLTQTVVIDMLNPLYKSIGDIVGFVIG